MTNHFHFLVHTDEKCLLKIKQGGILIDPISNSIRKLLSSYTRIYNSRYNQTGSLFRQKTKAKCVSEIKVLPDIVHLPEQYLHHCFNYIHQNPLKAKIVERLENWEFSSFLDYEQLRSENFCNKDLAEKYCGYISLDFISTSHKLVDEDIVDLFI